MSTCMMTVVEVGTGFSIFSQPQNTLSVHLVFVNYANTTPDPIHLKSTVKTTITTTLADNK